MPSRLLFCLLPVFFTGLAFAQSSIPATAPDGASYEGKLVNGLRQGQGKISWPGGVRYEGGFDHGLMSGKGRLEMPNGEVYEGEFQEGLMSGKGKLVSSRYQYEGEFRKGSLWGQGKQTVSNGTVYSGNFVRDQLEGQGRLETKTGEIYEGEFLAGELQKGKIISRVGGLYEGEVKNWLADGKGRYISPDKTEYSGSFTQGILNGKGSMTRGKMKYEGDFVSFAPEGEGTMTLENGDVYKGQFKYGMYYGKGTLTYAVPLPDGSRSKTGEWEYGQIKDPAAGKKYKKEVETALYQQQKLLDKALGDLQAGNNPDGTLFFLGVAGDGSQEVFHREVEFVRTQFDKDFSTRQHSINLVNSRNTLASEPLATKTSIREALQRIAAVMNKDKDILFLYMSSHGSRSHEFLLEPPDMKVANISADELGQMLRETGIRWKVVVISACYAGGFLEPLKDDGTLVITAARHDRSSFGCSDENDFTYFGEAFFKDALPQSSSFQQAFEKASVLVRQKETEDMKDEDGKVDEKRFSLPQMQNPAGIEARLKRWWPQRVGSRS